jgi:probable rRNA maturation factor
MPSRTLSPLLKLELIDAAGKHITPSMARELQLAANRVVHSLPKRLQFASTATVLITDNAAIKDMNNTFRGINNPTNVLSFPQFTAKQIGKQGKTKTTVELGDIAISYPYIVVEAKKDHKILKNHLTHMVIHGLLHLFGYDHIIENQAEHMEQLETQIMAALALPDPYASVHTKEPKRAHKIKKAKSRRPKR